MALLAAEGLALGGKEAAIKAKLADTLSTPLVSLKNTAYTSGAQRPGPLIRVGRFQREGGWWCAVWRGCSIAPGLLLIYVRRA